MPKNGDHLYSALLSYDGCDRLSAYAEEIGAGRSKRKTSFTYDNNDRPAAIAYGTDPKTTYTYDKLGRISQRKVYTTASNQYGTAYAYVPGDGTNRTTPLVASITQNGENLAYTYDDAGNILSEQRNSTTVSYEYDALGQLTRVNDPNDTTADPTGTTWVYTYDQGGNILSKAYYPYTTGSLGTPTGTVTYTYGDSNWKDKLTAYNNVSIAYDSIGNPTNDGTWTYTWEKGRQLKQMTSTGTTAAFDYNADGLRVRKTVNNVVTNYILHGKNIVHLTQGGDSLHFYYDAQNRPAIVDYNGTLYRYVYNLQGDVLGLLDSNNNEVVQYTYDAWGKILSVTGTLASTVGTVQPFRYRGYVYDIETGLYYLRSRYYNPVWQRFINADALVQGNLYCYCENEPVGMVDNTGCTPNSFHYVIDRAADQIRIDSERAFGIGDRSIIKAGYIGINLEKENTIINDLKSHGFPLTSICDHIAYAACEKYERIMGEPFILRWECVSYEIQEHVIAYQFSIGERSIPNAIALGFMLKTGSFDASKVREATIMTDIQQKDVKPGDFTSQAYWFHYREGINPIYIGTERDPWARSR